MAHTKPTPSKKILEVDLQGGPAAVHTNNRWKADGGEAVLKYVQAALKHCGYTGTFTLRGVKSKISKRYTKEVKFQHISPETNGILLLGCLGAGKASRWEYRLDASQSVDVVDLLDVLQDLSGDWNQAEETSGEDNSPTTIVPFDKQEDSPEEMDSTPPEFAEIEEMALKFNEAQQFAGDFDQDRFGELPGSIKAVEEQIESLRGQLEELKLELELYTEESLAHRKVLDDPRYRQAHKKYLEIQRILES